MQPRSWSRAWARAPWIRLLSGTTLSPSTVHRGVARWISSSLDSHANRGARRDDNAAPRTSGGSGPPSHASFAMLDPDGSFSKTSLDLFPEEDSRRSSPTLPYSGSMRNGCLYRRERSERRTDVGGSSSWPTAQTMDKEWGTPTAHQRTANPREVANGIQLANQASHWPTPMHRDWKNPGAKDGRASGQLADMSAEWQVAEWPTPHGFQAGNGPDGNEFSKAVRNWPTPVIEGRGTRPRANSKHGEMLQEVAREFPTPRFGPHGTPGHGLRHPTIENPGNESSPERRTLNPLFVEWLMNFPIGWTDSAPLGTESFRSWLRAHGGNCG